MKVSITLQIFAEPEAGLSQSSCKPPIRQLHSVVITPQYFPIKRAAQAQRAVSMN
jgi:hypothetical protein